MVTDLLLTLDYEQAAPLIMGRILLGKVIPKLEIHFTKTYGDASKKVYLAYELTECHGLRITHYAAAAQIDMPPTVEVANNSKGRVPRDLYPL